MKPLIPTDKRLIDEEDLPATLALFRSLSSDDADELAWQLFERASSEEMSPKQRQWLNQLAIALQEQAMRGADPEATLAFLDRAGQHRN